MEVWQSPKNVGFTWHFELFCSKSIYIHLWMISPNHSQRVRLFLPCLFRAAWGYRNDPVAYGNAQHPSVLKKILKRKVQLILFYLNSVLAVYNSLNIRMCKNYLVFQHELFTFKAFLWEVLVPSSTCAI